MNLHRLIGRLLAVLVIVGLVAAPLVSPVAAKRLPVGEMSDMAAMSGDMPAVRSVSSEARRVARKGGK